MEKHKLIFGVGINDAEYVVQEYATIGYTEGGKRKRKLVWICPFYLKWKNMLMRCYSSEFQEKQPTYKGCSVCKDWLTFSKFRSWMEKQDYEDKTLDKDILVSGNMVYSPETCVFVDRKVNNFSTGRNATRGEYLIGVYWHKRERKFAAKCNDGEGKLKSLGYFTTEIEAHQAWLTYKRKLAKILAEQQDDPRVAEALIRRYENYSEEK